MSTTHLTMLDVIKAQAADDVIGLIEENQDAAPEMGILGADTISGTDFTTLFRIDLPTVGFRDANEGTLPSKSRTELRKVQTFIVDSLIECDKAVADAYPQGAAAYQAFEASGVMQAALLKFGYQVYYGQTVAGDKGFPGLQRQYDASMEVDATGTTVGGGSSVYGIKVGPMGVQGIFGNNTTMSLDEWRIHMAIDAADSTKRYPAYYNFLCSWLGLRATNKHAIGRLKNLTAQDGKGLDDDLLADLLQKFPVGSRPDYWLMNRRSLGQLRKSRTATNATGAPAPFPTESHGIPIVVTDSIVSTEAIA